MRAMARAGSRSKRQLKKKKNTRRKRNSRLVARLRRALVWTVGAGLVLSLLLVVPLRWIDPPTSAFMLRDRLSGTAINQRWVEWQDIGWTLPIAVIASEDQNFPVHFGFDLAAVVELSQNIIRYSAERAQDPLRSGNGNELGFGIIAIGCHNKRYTVTSGNLIDNGRVEPLRRLLERLKTMDREQLRCLFLEQRKSSPPDGSLGAGLGIIDISRKAGEPVEFEFRPVDDRVSFFSIKIVI